MATTSAAAAAATTTATPTVTMSDSGAPRAVKNAVAENNSDVVRKPLRVAVLGAGIIACSAHYTALMALGPDAARVVAVWSRTAHKAQALAARYGADVAWFDGIGGVEKVLQRPDVDACVLAVPIMELASLSTRCLDAGKHVLSEKPIAHSVAAARPLLARASSCSTAASEGPLFAVAENFRFEGGVMAAAVDAARLNPVCISLVAAVPMPPGSRFATPWRLAPRYVGAQLLDGGVHFVAAMRAVAKADVVRVAARTSTASMHLAAPDSTSAMLEFANGVHATLMISYAAAEFVWEMRVIATDGDLLLRRSRAKPGYVLETRLGGSMEAQKVTREYPFSGIDDEFRFFVASCHAGKLDPRLQPTHAFNDLATIEAIVRSAEKNEMVEVQVLEP